MEPCAFLILTVSNIWEGREHRYVCCAMVVPGDGTDENCLDCFFVDERRYIYISIYHIFLYLAMQYGIHGIRYSTGTTVDV